MIRRLPQASLLLVCITTALIQSTTMEAQAPQTIVLQGQLFQKNGEPLADGEYPVVVTMASHSPMVSTQS